MKAILSDIEISTEMKNNFFVGRKNSEEEEEEDEKANDGKILKTADLSRIFSSVERLTDEVCEIDGDFNRKIC